MPNWVLITPLGIQALIPSPTEEQFGKYDFGLSTEQEQHAARLHRESIIIDMLFQGPCGYRSFTAEMLAQLRQNAARLTPTEQYFATVFAPIRAALQGKSNDFRECWEQSGISAGNRQVGFGLPAYAIAQAQFDTFPWLAKALKAADIRAAKAKGLRAGFLSTQDSDGLQDRRSHGARIPGCWHGADHRGDARSH